MARRGERESGRQREVKETQRERERDTQRDLLIPGRSATVGIVDGASDLRRISPSPFPSSPPRDEEWLIEDARATQPKKRAPERSAFEVMCR